MQPNASLFTQDHTVSEVSPLFYVQREVLNQAWQQIPYCGDRAQVIRQAVLINSAHLLRNGKGLCCLKSRKLSHGFIKNSEGTEHQPTCGRLTFKDGRWMRQTRGARGSYLHVPGGNLPGTSRR